MPYVVILIPEHSFCNTVCVCMVMQIKLVVVVVESEIDFFQEFFMKNDFLRAYY